MEEKYHGNKVFNTIINKIRKYDIVSFDVFDTLIFRTCGNHEEVFFLAAQAIVKKYSIDLSVNEIVSARIAAEYTARRKASKRDVTIDEIYESFDLKGLDLVAELKNEEINTELSVCVASGLMKSIYDWCYINKKSIIIISDMYLSSEIIKKILEKNGYDKNVAIFVSSEFGETKKNGNLYKIVLKKYKNAKIIHIGDALRSDYIQARINGFNAYHIKRDSTYDRVYILAGNEISHNGVVLSDYYKFGYDIFGPAVLGFCKWLCSEIEKNKVDRIFFLARDGYLIKRIFNFVYPEYNDITDYLYVSRKALRLSSLYGEKNVEKLASLFPQHTLLTIKDLCEKIGVSDINPNLVDDAKLFLPGQILSDAEIFSFCNWLLKFIQPKCKREKELLKQYLKEKRFMGKVAIIDIGWAGTIQNMLTNITDVDIIGYYFGTNIFDSSEKKRSYVNPMIAIQEFVAALIEYPFLAPEGSVEKYAKNEQGFVEPVLSNFEYDDGEREIIIAMQNGIYDYAREHHSQSGDCGVSDALVNNLIRVCRKPNRKELEMLGDLTYYENGVYYLANPDNLYNYLVKPKNLKRDLSRSGWKIGFLKKLFKININYYRILKLMKKK